MWSYSPSSAIAAGSTSVTGTFTSSSANYSSGTASGTLKIDAAMPTLSWATPSAVFYGTTLSSVQLNATASVPGTFVYNPLAGTIPPVGNDTLSVTFTPNDPTNYRIATASVTLIVNPTNPAPTINGISPAFTRAAGSAFTLTINGSGFTAGSTVFWGTSALVTQYLNSGQLTAQVTATNIATAGTAEITVQTPAPGGGASNAWEFQVDSIGSETMAPIVTSTTATVNAGSTASYPVTLPSSVKSASVRCLNLPVGATCSYSFSTGIVTIATSPTTPAGTYLVTMVFTETVSVSSSAGILLPILLLPLLSLRRRLAARGVWLTACFGLALLAAAASSIGCGGGSGSTPTPINQTHQIESSGAVTITVH